MPFFVPVAAVTLLIMQPFVTPQQTKPAPATTAPAKPRPAELRFVLHLVRQSDAPSVLAAPATPAPSATPATATTPTAALMATPILVTVDGQTASMEVKSTDTTFFVSLSPTLELADNTGKPESEAKKSTVRLDWNLRLGGKTLPGGVTSMSMTGASRLVLDDTADAIIAQVSLADPKTGQITQYRLEGQVQIPNKPETTAAPVVTPAPTNP